MRKICRVLVALMLVCCLAGSAAGCFAEDAAVSGSDTGDYQLEKVIVFGRHNMRAPTKHNGELMAQLTPYEWCDYTAPNGELTLLGGTQETAMGQYFGEYLVSKGLIEDNWMPEEGQVRFYSNSYQRTMATTRYFLAGMLPVADVSVEVQGEFGKMDSVYRPCLHFISDAYLEQVQAEMDAFTNGEGLQGYISGYADAIAVLEDTIDFADSEYAKENGVTSIPIDDSAITYTLGEEPSASGGLKILNAAADALIMQYYAEPDEEKAAFGHTLTWDQWCAVGSLNSMYVRVMFGLPSVAVNVANPLLKEIRSEMADDERVFSFFCGHDSNVVPLLVSLGVEDYTVQDNVCTYTPIGCNLVLEKYRGGDGEEYAAFSMVYRDSVSLRENRLVTLNDPPAWLELSFSGLEKNADGYYRWDDVVSRFDEAIAAFDELPGNDGSEEELTPAA